MKAVVIKRTDLAVGLIQGSEKTALIDAVDPTMEHILMARLDDLLIKTILKMATAAG